MKKQQTILNKSASYKYEVVEKLEAGISLAGCEIKSVKSGKVNLRDSWCRIKAGEMYVIGMHIAPYDMVDATQSDMKPDRDRKLLVHKSEIRALRKKVMQEGMTLIPLDMHTNEDGKAKLTVALCRGKKYFDKRNSIKTKEGNREISRGYVRNSKGKNNTGNRVNTYPK